MKNIKIIVCMCLILISGLVLKGTQASWNSFLDFKYCEHTSAKSNEPGEIMGMVLKSQSCNVLFNEPHVVAQLKHQHETGYTDQTNTTFRAVLKHQPNDPDCIFGAIRGEW